MKCAIYARVSTRDMGQDIDNQLLSLRQFCQAQGWEISRTYEDHESGAKSTRIGFQTMLHDAAQRRWDLLLFWALDRLTREGTLATLKYLELLEGYGVRWRSFTEPWIDSAGPFRDVIISLLASLAKQERLRMSERIKAGMARSKAQGKPIGPPRKIISPAALDKAIKADMSLAQMAQMFGVSRTTMHRRAREQAT